MLPQNEKIQGQLKKIFASVMLGVTLSVIPAATDGKTIELVDEYDPTGLWKTDKFDVVMSIEQCAEKQFCPRIHWIGPEETKIFDYFSYLASKPERRAPVIHSKSKRHTKPSPGISRERILELCDKDIKFDIQAIPDTNQTRWKGKLYVKSPNGFGLWVHAKVSMTNNDRIDLKISKFFLKKKGTWTRVPPERHSQYPKCSPSPVKVP